MTLGFEKQNEHENKISEIEFNCISGWQLAPLKKEVMNGLVHDD